MFKFAKLLFLTLLIVSCSQEQEQKPATPLMIKTVNGDIRFSVEVAKTPEELQTGLMHRTNLGFNSGMIFDIYPVRPTAMWMKNTKIPLDMLFIAPDGSIIMIKENAEPMSEEQIICKEPIRAVIEINGGQVKRHGIKIGDKVTHMIFNNMLDVKNIGPTPQPNTPNAIVPKGNIPVPQLGNGPIIPKPGAIQPKPGAIVPKVGTIQPKPGAIVPKTGIVAPGQTQGPIKLPVPTP